MIQNANAKRAKGAPALICLRFITCRMARSNILFFGKYIYFSTKIIRGKFGISPKMNTYAFSRNDQIGRGVMESRHANRNS